MCGITGYYRYTDSVELEANLEVATAALRQRGPDFRDHFVQKSIGLGHARLSVLDTSAGANQPMFDPGLNYALVFNGEIYNFLELKKRLPDVDFLTTSDTEVLLHLLIHYGVDCLKELNGFFAFCFVDLKKQSFLLARDRMGIKPLHYYHSDNFFAFGSEMKALMAYPFKRELNEDSLYWYLKLNYLPGTKSMLRGVQKLQPGNWLKVDQSGITTSTFVDQVTQSHHSDYATSQKQLIDLLDVSVKRRLISDVPLGAFLSGGTDSSAIVSMATRHVNNLSTFSIGYRDHKFFDETHYAELVAQKFGTNHTTFSLTNDDLIAHVDDIINYTDEPFADSSAIPTFILSKLVKQKVTVALSGDGADELFGGYYRHLALSKALQSNFSNRLIRWSSPILSILPKSRSTVMGNIIRRLDRFGHMMSLGAVERYWFLSSLTDDPLPYFASPIDSADVESFKNSFFVKEPKLRDYLLADQKVVLVGDMLTKVDLMSMANGLEVRVPFLDKEVVAFSRSLPDEYKLSGNQRKRIVQDAFKDILPMELYHRPKKGFEVPILQWMRNELLSDLDQTLFDKEYLKAQNLLSPEAVLDLRKKLFSANPEDVHGIIWALYVFQKWYRRYLQD